MKNFIYLCGLLLIAVAFEVVAIHPEMPIDATYLLKITDKLEDVKLVRCYMAELVAVNAENITEKNDNQPVVGSVISIANVTNGPIFKKGEYVSSQFLLAVDPATLAAGELQKYAGGFNRVPIN